MRNNSKLLLAGLAAAFTLGALVSAASASRLATSSQTFRTTWNALRFIGFITIECHVTIEGSFHSRSITKNPEQLIGYVTRAVVDETHCTGGSARALSETLPWHIRYDSIAGTLPEITGITLRLVGAAFRVQTGGTACLFTSSASSPMKGVINRNTSTGVAETLTPEAAQIPRTSGSATLCGASGRLGANAGTVTVQNSTAKITVTLIG